jgi:hypothetical protein
MFFGWERLRNSQGRGKIHSQGIFFKDFEVFEMRKLSDLGHVHNSPLSAGEKEKRW